MSLSNDELVRFWRKNAPLPLPYFDDRQVELFFEDEEELLHFADAIRNFLTLGPADRIADTMHLHAYYRDFTEDVGFDWVDPEMRHLAPGSPDIWHFVSPTSLGAMDSWDVGAKDRSKPYVVLEANCGWEVEHGLLMSWREGVELVKVSGYDGHATNGHAYSDLSKDQYIYHSQRPERCTMNPAVVPPRQPRSFLRWPWKKGD